MSKNNKPAEIKNSGIKKFTEAIQAINRSTDEDNNSISDGATSFLTPGVTNSIEESDKEIKSKSTSDSTVELAAAREFKTTLQNEIKNRLLNDLDWRIENRGKVWKFTAFFFAIQNLIVFGLVGASFTFKPNFDLTTVFSIVIPVSLGATAYTIKEVTKFLFNEVDYNQYLEQIRRIEGESSSDTNEHKQ